MAEPAKIDLNTVRRGDTYVVDFFFTDTDGTKDITAVTIDAQARKEMDGTLWFDLKPIVVDASKGHFRIHLTHEETRQLTEAPPNSFSGIYDIQFSWAGANETYVSTIVAGSISISKDVTQVPTAPSGTAALSIPANQEINVYYSLNPGSPNYSDVVTAEQLTPVQYELVASLGLANINAINEAGMAAKRAKEYADKAAVSATEAAESQTKAKQSEQIATIQAAKATTEADRAKSEADKAAAVVTGGDATFDPTPGKIPLADNKGKIDYGWLNVIATHARTKADFEQMRQQNNDLYAASGFVHPGKHRDSGSNEVPINEGLFTAILKDYPNTLFSGNENKYKVGKSKTDFAVTQIAGVISNLIALDINYFFQYKLPEAPDGTVVYDSAVGTVTKHASVDSAFNELKNKVPDSIADPASYNPATNTFSFTGNAQGVSWANKVTSGRQKVLLVLESDVEGKTLEIKDSNTTAGADPTIKTIQLSAGKITTVEFIHDYANTNTYLRSADNTIGSIKIHAFQVLKESEEVVTERVDLVGLEYFLEEVTQANPFVYPNGCIQSQATSMNGITTTRSNRPDTYYAVYDGDSSSAGKGVDFWAATEAQKVAMLSDASNNLFNFGDDLVPKIVQWRVRQRSIAGAGNGDWENVSPTGTAIMFKGSPSYTQVSAKGIQDNQLDYYKGEDNAAYYGNGHATPLTDNLGVFRAGKSGTVRPQVSVDGECYFYVVATVPRLNQGAYHPSFNHLGASKFRTVDHSHYAYKWNTTDVSVNSVCDCFSLSSAQPGAGSIDGGDSYCGHPDGRFYDAIYASGQGGVIDHRPKYGAWDASRPEQAAEVFQEVVNGKYRGVEKLVWTEIRMDESFAIDIFNSAKRIGSGAGTEPFKGIDISKITAVYINNKKYPVKRYAGTYIELFEIPDLAGYTRGIESQGWHAYTPTTTGKAFVIERELNVSVSGDFIQTDVIGDPAQILSTPQLKNGWVGSWIPVIPEGNTKTFKLSRENRGRSVDLLYTLNTGRSWTSIVQAGYDSDMNTIISSKNATEVNVLQYTAFAKQTEQSINKSVLFGFVGLGEVFVTNDAHVSSDSGRGVQLKESLIGGVSGSRNYNKGRIQQLPLSQASFVQDGMLTSQRVAYVPKHGEVLIDGGSNVDTVKVLPHQVEDNHQASLNFIANELKHNGTDWGDDNTVKVIEKGSYTNKNGEICLADIHTLAIPYGYIKQK